MFGMTESIRVMLKLPYFMTELGDGRGGRGPVQCRLRASFIQCFLPARRCVMPRRGDQAGTGTTAAAGQLS